MLISRRLLKWWLMFCIILLGGGVAIYFDIHTILYFSDLTKLSFLILLIFLSTSIWIGKKTYDMEYSNDINVGWFIAESCLALGMIGTVTGFLIMLGEAFKNIDVSNTVTLQNALSTMAVGMSTALYTTLIGLISSLLIKVQLINYETDEE
tara:strand:+ start:56 stop:508 length:453 start_codon:yes stop_codon:yes gene_type:complete